MRRKGAALAVVASLLVAQRTAAAVVLSCRQGQQGSEQVRGLQTGDRRYPFCLLETPLDDGCRFSFCPNLDAVVDCALVPRCLVPIADCRNPDVPREAFTVRPRGPHRRGLLRLEHGGGVILLECRPPRPHGPLAHTGP